MIGLSDNDPAKENQVAQWLKKLERESWQLELLVSAFTIFLLIQANIAYQDFFRGLRYAYNLNGDILAFVFFFFGLLGVSIKALTLFLVFHLMLRGFWIGAIGLRSVQPTIDFSALNYSQRFTDRLKKKVRSLDDLVILLDQVCSVIFSFSFLVISMLIAFGLYLLFLGVIVFTTRWVNNLAGETVSVLFGLLVVPLTLITGLIYLIDYFSLGFFKKFKWFSKYYMPFYRFYGFITFSGISRSIYYYLITKFSKKRIRWMYLFVMAIWIFSFTMEFDQKQFYSDESESYFIESDYYDDERQENQYVGILSIPSKVIQGAYMPLFIRYDPVDNSALRAICTDFDPPKKEGWNTTLRFTMRGGNVNLGADESSEDTEAKMLSCINDIYRITINDSTYEDLEMHFYEHPAKKQEGMLSMLNTRDFNHGLNKLKFEKQQLLTGQDSLQWIEASMVTFWFNPN